MNNLAKRVLERFKSSYESEPLLFFSPGRVNLIGEHTDYNNGFVLPAAIDKAIVLALAKNDTGLMRLQSIDMQPKFHSRKMSKNHFKSGIDWADYIIGVIDELQKAGYDIDEGFDCVFGGDVPIGAGLSSSAALEGGVAYGLSKLFDLNVSRLELTKISQKAENNFVGVQCGIMDQFASIHGKEKSVIKLDCLSLEHEYYPFEWDDVCILLCDTKVRRTLAGSEYNVRRQQCEEGVRIIKETYPQVESLRDVTFEMLTEHQEKMDEVVYRRCMYVLNENKRVLDACQDLMDSNLPSFGARMYQSHYGLRDNYEVSCDELNHLVDATEDLDSVLGSRMMGGGFGGCTINLVKTDEIENIQAKIEEYYKGKTGESPGFHVVKIGEGTHELELTKAHQ